MVTVPFSRKLRPIFTAMIRIPASGPMINPPRITGRSEKSIFTNPGASGTGNSMAIKTALTAPIKALKTRGLTAIFPALFVAAVFPAHTSRAALRHVRFILTPPSFLTPVHRIRQKDPGSHLPGRNAVQYAACASRRGLISTHNAAASIAVFPLFPSGLYRRFRNLTGSTAAIGRRSWTVTTGQEFHLPQRDCFI